MLKISYSSAYALRRDLQFIVVIGFKEDALSFAETVSYCPVCSLTEISALGVFKVRSACGKSYLHICYWRTRKDSDMSLFFKVSEDKPLPVFVEFVLFAVRFLWGGVQVSGVLRHSDGAVHSDLLPQ